MGGDSTSSSTTVNQTTQVSGSNGVNGDNYGAQISGVNNSNITVTATDFGAVGGAFDFATEAIETAFKSNENITSNAVDAVIQTNDSLKDMAMQTAANSKDNMNFAKDILSESITSIENAQSGGAVDTIGNIKEIVMILIISAAVVGGVYAYKRK